MLVLHYMSFSAGKSRGGNYFIAVEQVLSSLQHNVVRPLGIDAQCFRNGFPLLCVWIYRLQSGTLICLTGEIWFLFRVRILIVGFARKTVPQERTSCFLIEVLHFQENHWTSRWVNYRLFLCLSEAFPFEFGHDMKLLLKGLVRLSRNTCNFSFPAFYQ